MAKKLNIKIRDRTGGVTNCVEPASKSKPKDEQ
jgi:hypothetical protein